MVPGGEVEELGNGIKGTNRGTGRATTCRPQPGVLLQPYAENFIGKPHVWTVDDNNSEESEAAIKAIMETQVRRPPLTLWASL